MKLEIEQLITEAREKTVEILQQMQDERLRSIVLELVGIYDNAIELIKKHYYK